MTKPIITAVLILAVFISGCSLYDNLKKKLGGQGGEQEDTVKEETAGTTSQNDLLFYNKYIEVLNKISETVEQFNKAYLNDVPEPRTIDKNSMIFVISTEVYAGNLDRLYKEYNRSLNDNGELSKLEADNKTMKQEVEENLRAVLKIIEEYHKLAVEVIEYYKNEEFEHNAPMAITYDDRMEEQYNKYKDAFDKLNAALRKYKPLRTMRDPDKISNPDERAVTVLMNTYENTLDGAELFYEKFQRVNKESDVSQISNLLDEFEKNFKDDKAKVESTGFTEKTKYMKYNFEDYFAKTVNDFIKHARNFIGNAKTKKMDTDEFNRGYDDVINYYNYMINAYNSSIGVLNTFQAY